VVRTARDVAVDAVDQEVTEVTARVDIVVVMLVRAKRAALQATMLLPSVVDSAVVLDAVVPLLRSKRIHRRWRG
jgi:hypothetical protein